MSGNVPIDTTTKSLAFVRGFVEKCASLGFSPEETTFLLALHQARTENAGKEGQVACI